MSNVFRSATPCLIRHCSSISGESADRRTTSRGNVEMPVRVPSLKRLPGRFTLTHLRHKVFVITNDWKLPEIPHRRVWWDIQRHLHIHELS